MFVWSKKLVFGLLAGFCLLLTLFMTQAPTTVGSALKSHTTFYLLLNLTGLVIWVFVWMIDQARMRGKNVWVWLVPFLLAPVPTLMIFIVYLQRRL